MKLEEFVDSRRGRWSELEASMNRVGRRRFRQMPVSEISRMAALYRSASSDLAIATRDFPDEQVHAYLNNLCVKANALISQGEPLRLGAIADFLKAGFPRVFRRNLRFF